MLWLAGQGVAVLEEDTFNVPVHGKATCALIMLGRIVPFQVDTCEFRAVPISGHFIMFFQDVEEVPRMLFANVFDTKVINNENELDRTPFVLPQSRRCGAFIIASLFKSPAEEVVGQFSTLWQAIASSYNFIVYPSIVDKRQQIVFVNDLLGNVRELDADILWTFHRGLEIKVLGIKTNKFGIGARQDTIDHELDEV